MAVKRRWDPPRSGNAPDRWQQEEGHHSTATEKPTVSNGRFHPHAIGKKQNTEYRTQKRSVGKLSWESEGKTQNTEIWRERSGRDNEKGRYKKT